MMAYDTGFHNEEYGSFPTFACASIDSNPSCKSGGFTDDIYLYREQFCHFKVNPH